MRGAGILYNTYWVQYARGQTTFDRAVENTKTLFEAAESADVGRVVHSSVAKTLLLTASTSLLGGPDL